MILRTNQIYDQYVLYRYYNASGSGNQCPLASEKNSSRLTVYHNNETLHTVFCILRSRSYCRYGELLSFYSGKKVVNLPKIMKLDPITNVLNYKTLTKMDDDEFWWFESCATKQRKSVERIDLNSYERSMRNAPLNQFKWNLKAFAHRIMCMRKEAFM